MSRKKYEATRRYEATAQKYDDRYEDIQKRKYLEVFTHQKIDESDIIVDIGGGTGLLIGFLPENQKNIIVCDISFEMLKAGKRKFNKGMFVCADSEQLPFRKDSSDITTCFSLIQNLQQPDYTITECYNISKMGGIFILSALTKLFESEVLCKKLEEIGFDIIKKWILTIEDLAILAKKRRI